MFDLRGLPAVQGLSTPRPANLPAEESRLSAPRSGESQRPHAQRVAWILLPKAVKDRGTSPPVWKTHSNGFKIPIRKLPYPISRVAGSGRPDPCWYPAPLSRPNCVPQRLFMRLSQFVHISHRSRVNSRSGAKTSCIDGRQNPKTGRRGFVLGLPPDGKSGLQPVFFSTAYLQNPRLSAPDDLSGPIIDRMLPPQFYKDALNP